MTKVKRMSTVHLKSLSANIAHALESIFQNLTEEFRLEVRENELGLDVLKDLEARNDGFKLNYQRISRDTRLQDEGLRYSGKLFSKPLEIYIDSYFRKPSLSYTISSDQLAKYRPFLIDLSEGTGDLAMRLALGSWLPDPRNKKQIFQNVDLQNFSGVYDFLKRHIKAR